MMDQAGRKLICGLRPLGKPENAKISADEKPAEIFASFVGSVFIFSGLQLCLAGFISARYMLTEMKHNGKIK